MRPGSHLARQDLPLPEKCLPAEQTSRFASQVAQGQKAQGDTKQPPSKQNKWEGVRRKIIRKKERPRLDFELRGYSDQF